MNCPSILCGCANCERKTGRFFYNNRIIDRPYYVAWLDCKRTYYKNVSSTKGKDAKKFSLLRHHNEQLEMFKNKEGRVAELNTKIKRLRRDIEKSTNENYYKLLNNDHGKDTIDAHEKATRLEKLETEAKLISVGHDEQMYLLYCMPLVTSYIDIEERELQFFAMSNLTQEEERELSDLRQEKQDIVGKYRAYFGDIESSHVEMTNDWQYCESCGVSGEMVIDRSNCICAACGAAMAMVELDSPETLAYKDREMIDTKPQFTYDKRSHLEDWLRRFQAKENRSIPQEILDKVVLEAKKERVKNLDLLTEDKVKRYLKRLGLNDYYDNVINIINRINGRPPFLLTTEIEEKIKHMFQQIQEPYEKHKPKNRKNFLSYSYTLHKFFQILGLNEFSKYFPLLKSPEKLRQQDDIFKKVAAEMAMTDPGTNWVFYPSI
jgi:hypothetical protein